MINLDNSNLPFHHQNKYANVSSNSAMKNLDNSNSAFNGNSNSECNTNIHRSSHQKHGTNNDHNLNRRDYNMHIIAVKIITIITEIEEICKIPYLLIWKELQIISIPISSFHMDAQHLV